MATNTDYSRYTGVQRADTGIGGAVGRILMKIQFLQGLDSDQKITDKETEKGAKAKKQRAKRTTRTGGTGRESFRFGETSITEVETPGIFTEDIQKKYGFK